MFQGTSSNCGRNSSTRPHSKTTVIGPSLKTRLHCTHLKPKCKCSNVNNQKRSHKTRHTVIGTTSQRRILSSSRALPRGETDGRKIYHKADESVSVCDATWRPNLSNFSKDKSKTSIKNYKHRSGDGKLIKKKLRFEDQTVELEGKHNSDQVTDSIKDVNKGQIHDEVHPLLPHGIPSTYSQINLRVSERKNRESSNNYCRLCEEKENGFFYDTCRKRKNNEVPTDSSKCSLKVSTEPNYKSFQENHDICFLCHRSEHNCKDDDQHCRTCDYYIDSPGSQYVAEDRLSLDKRNPTARHISGDESQQLSSPRIPYRPRTKFVKNLKQKLETTYKKESSIHKDELETFDESKGAESNKGPQRHHINQYHMHPGKKCLHRYQQNERLFLEPTVTNRKGQSICSECGAPQPSSPQKHPYVYHITLGPMKSTNGRECNGSRSHSSQIGKENDTSNRGIYKKSNDTSKFVYAKLNDGINNIFWKKGMYSTSRPSVQTNFLTSLPLKRHPSRSVALVDHII